MRFNYYKFNAEKRYEVLGSKVFKALVYAKEYLLDTIAPNHLGEANVGEVEENIVYAKDDNSVFVFYIIDNSEDSSVPTVGTDPSDKAAV